MDITLEDLYAQTVLKEETGCREWQLGTNGRYGIVRLNGRKTGVHRVAYMLAHNVELSSSDFICHTCDNPACINVDHLFLGDALINARDRDTKHRRIAPKGEQNGASKLTQEQVRNIRREAHRGASQAHLSRQYRVNPRTIKKIVTRKTWAWL